MGNPRSAAEETPLLGGLDDFHGFHGQLQVRNMRNQKETVK